MSKLTIPAALEWRVEPAFPRLYECFIADQMVAWMEPRPSYCDRGHWKMCCELPDLDEADSFPRYFMDFDRGKAETEDWLRWRLWKIKKFKPLGETT